MVFPHKGGHAGDNEDVVRSASETRPIILKNCDNEIIAGVVNRSISPVLESSASTVQNGFIKGRNFLHNVVKLDVDGRNCSSEFWGACDVFLTRALFLPSISLSCPAIFF